MAFIQIIEMEFDPDRWAEIQAMEEEWRARTEGERTVVRNTWCQDRANPARLVNIVEFENYEDALRNNELPATQELAARMSGLVRSVRYLDLDVRETREG